MSDWSKYLDEQEREATYVVAFAHDYPDSSSIAGQDGFGTDVGMRTLFEIYKLNADKLWEPDDLEDIMLDFDFELKMTLTIPQLWGWIEKFKFNFNEYHFKALVFLDPFIGEEFEDGSDQLGSLHKLMETMPQSIEALSIRNMARMPQKVFVPFMNSRAFGRTVRMPYIKGVCMDFFVQFFSQPDPPTLHVIHITMDSMPTDDMIFSPLIELIQKRMTFDKGEGKVHYTNLDCGGRDRGFYPLEPTLVALQAKMQICVVNEVDFTRDRVDNKLGNVLAGKLKLGGVTNDVTEELVIILSTVKGIAATAVLSGSEQPSTSAAGNGTRHGPHDAFAYAFKGIFEVYTKLKKLRIIFTDKRIYNIKNKESYRALTNYMQWFAGILGVRTQYESGLITAASVLQRNSRKKGRAVNVEIYAHQILHVFHPQANSKQWQLVGLAELGGDQWTWGKKFTWLDPEGVSHFNVHRVDHKSKHHVRGDDSEAYFDCEIQITECGDARNVDEIPPDFHTDYARVQQEGATTVYGGFNKAKRKLQHDLSGEALLRYRLDDKRPLPFLYSYQEWSEADPFDWLASRPLQPNALAQGQPPETTIVNE